MTIERKSNEACIIRWHTSWSIYIFLVRLIISTCHAFADDVQSNTLLPSILTTTTTTTKATFIDSHNYNNVQTTQFPQTQIISQFTSQPLLLPTTLTSPPPPPPPLTIPITETKIIAAAVTSNSPTNNVIDEAQVLINHPVNTDDFSSLQPVNQLNSSMPGLTLIQPNFTNGNIVNNNSNVVFNNSTGQIVATTNITATSNITTGSSSSSSSLTATTNGQNNDSVCFYAENEICYLPREIPGGCKECLIHPTIPNSLICCNVTDIEKAMNCIPHPNSADNSSIWLNLHIFNATLDELDFSQKYWKRLESLIVTDGHINRISKEFPKFSSPQCINISNNHINHIQPRAFKELTRLQMLDISHNNLTSMPNLNSISTNLSLDIRGNVLMLCKSVLELIERGGVNFVDSEATNCLTNQTFNWFNSTDSIPLKQLIRLNKFQSECPSIPGYGNCTCEAEQMTFEAQDQSGSSHFIITAKVDCSNMGLTELPEELPTNTLFLNVTNNNISSLSTFNKPSYEHLVKFEADDNQIWNILDLEGTNFMKNFYTLHLRRNKIKVIPIYLLSNILEKSTNGRQLYLEGNQLNCDCNSAKTLKLWLLSKQAHISDYDRILCENYNHQKVTELSEVKLCQSQHDWTDYIYYLISLEVILLVALVLKVSYDYWIFKTAGYLPWPASKMPKLPCDCLCEA